MPQRESFIQQSTVFDQLGEPYGYADLPSMDKHLMRQAAKGRYDTLRGQGHNHKFAAAEVVDEAKRSTRYYIEKQRRIKANARCGAATRRGTACKQRGPALGPSGRCKYHGGKSTGPITIEGRIKAICRLKQYKARPDLLAARIEAIRAEAL